VTSPRFGIVPRRSPSRRWVLAVAAGSLLLGGGVALGASLGITSSKLTTSTLVATVPLSTCTLTASADTYADGSLLSQGSNFGTQTSMTVRSSPLGGNARSFVNFALASCGIPAAARVTAATLRLFLATAPAASRTYELFRVSAAWGETSLTWSNQPGVGSASGSVSTGTTNGVTLSWNVLTDVRSFVSGSATNNGWRVSDSAEGSLVARTGILNTRESASNSPVLDITYYP
jgi:hypothetical protein